MKGSLFGGFRWVFSRLFGTKAAKLIWRVPGAHRLYQWLMPNLRPATVEVDGHTIHLDAMDSLLLSINGNYEQFEQSVFKACLRPGDTVVDVGAHIGLYTLQAARTVGPDGRVIAFEPSSANFALLARNIEANEYAQVELVQAAVADVTGRMELSLSAENTGDHSLVGASTADRETEGVDVVTLDDAVGASPVAVWKMDVQGAEPAVLAGAKRMLEASPEVVLFTELSPGHLRDWGGTAAYVDSLVDAGFALFELDEHAATLRPVDPVTLGELPVESTAVFLNLVCAKGAKAKERLLAAVA
ncbi:hypothetical protein GCM10009721_34030 [Terrabacter tumescens]|uniref:Methyltransferase FkbM domain-containing protein n=1 Tax=Terrabacter tumescens TaxID=60443 RepID=A0ABQ2IA37_9MICO|nr:hypothetical protein GCM10009721_34030 [Terrabacter tumescens]